MIHKVLKDLLRNVHTIIEIGSHNGNDTKILHKSFPAAEIHTFEANKDLYDRYLLGLQSDKIKIINKAVGNKNGTVTFYIDKNLKGNAGASSVLKSSSNYLRHHIKKEESRQVDMIRMEDYIKNNEISKINLLWMDIEGYEFYVLNDSINILRDIQYIYLEVNFQPFRKDTVLFPIIHKFMTKYKFELIYKEPQGSSRWGIWQGNVLYKNTRYTEN